MADDVDMTTERMEREMAQLSAAVTGYTIPVGKAGDCDMCGEWSGRLVDGECAPCRDRYSRHGR